MQSFAKRWLISINCIAKSHGVSGDVEMKKCDIVRIVEDALQVKSGSLSVDSVAKEVPAWDSMGLLAIMSVLDEYGITFATGDTELLLSMPKIIQLFEDAGKLD
ncbi:MAG: hypothetical protein P8L85_15525 [Rubripirellula sp.]|nr:hypothetical protein [Rubripirellula sp.]